jgi:hypothetical protein
MPQVAVAFSNNHIVAWTFDRHLDGCPGFAIHQIDVDNNNKETILPAIARFTGQTGADLTTAQAPIQKFWWKDLKPNAAVLMKISSFRRVASKKKPARRSANAFPPNKNPAICGGVQFSGG